MTEEQWDESNEAVQDWRRLEQSITTALAGDHPVVRIPGWEPVGFADGMFWARENVLEGSYVRYRLDRSTSPPTLWFKDWEDGDPEPLWHDVIPSG